MAKKWRFRGRFNKEHGKGLETLLKSMQKLSTVC